MDTHFGPGAVSKVPTLVQQLRATRIFLVADSVAFEASGARDRLASLWKACEVTRFSDFAANPSYLEVAAGISQFRQAEFDLVLAVGGGTAIDLAKLIGTLGVHETPALELIAGRQPIEKQGPPLMAVPTTAGTGSEATRFAVAYVDQVKYSVAHDFLLPSVAIVDPTLSAAAPRHVRAAAGMDAFAQAVESIWAVGAEAASQDDAEEAIQLALENLPAVVQDPTIEQLSGMSHAANLAGRAINISKTTASHALSYALTIRYGLPHGLAVALTLSRLLRFNAGVSDDDCLDRRGPAAVRARIERLLNRLDAKDVDEGAAVIERLAERVGAPGNLEEAGIAIDQANDLAAAVNVERLANNPRRCTRKDLVYLLTGHR